MKVKPTTTAGEIPLKIVLRTAADMAVNLKYTGAESTIFDADWESPYAYPAEQP